MYVALSKTAQGASRSLVRGFALVELLVVITIVGLLLTLLAVAVVKARESASLTHCGNNLKQIGFAVQNHQDAYGRFPSGGWGWRWVGAPDRGTGATQPGGWIYNILPFIEKGRLREVEAVTDSSFEERIATLLRTPLSQFVCPSRRDGGPYLNGGQTQIYNAGTAGGVTIGVKPDRLARSDYAGNSGDQEFSQMGAGPDTLTDGDSKNYEWPDPNSFSGIFFPRSAVQVRHLTRGSSNIFLAGERYCNYNHYYDGTDFGDNESMYSGFDNDVCRVTFTSPRQDGNEFNGLAFGSAHVRGLNMLYCDGSVRFTAYDADQSVFMESGRRMR